MAAKWERYFTPNSTHRRLGMACLGAGRQEGLAFCPPRVLRCYAAVLVLDGVGWLEAGDPPTVHEIAAPALFWLFPDRWHSYGPDARGWRESWILFEGSAAGAYEELGYLSRTGPVVSLIDPTVVRHTMARLLDTCRDERPGVEVTSAQLVHELVLGAQETRGSRDTVVLDALRDGACSPVSVGEQAAHLGMSRTALRRVVRRAAGCAPKEYILRVRLNRAKVLLAGSDRTVAEIAKEVGYPDPAYFTRVFTQRAGMSPRAFRNQQRRRGP